MLPAMAFLTEYDEYMRKRPLVPGRGTVLGRAVIEGRPVQVHDVTVDPEYTLTEGQRLGGFRTVLGVPLMREGTADWVIMLTRNTVRPFTDKQIELVTTFADQAAIAIENVRLFEERRGPHTRIGRVIGGPAHDTGPPRPNTEACLSWSAHRRHRARDQEPAQFRQQFLRGLRRIDR